MRGNFNIGRLKSVQVNYNHVSKKYGSILLPLTCKLDNVRRQLVYVHIRLIQVNLHLNYVDMQNNLNLMFT